MKIAAATLFVLSVAQIAAADVRVTPLVREGRVWVSFGIEEGPAPELEPNTEYYVRVRARTQPRDSMIFWRWDSGLVSTNANFTFTP